MLTLPRSIREVRCKTCEPVLITVTRRLGEAGHSPSDFRVKVRGWSFPKRALKAVQTVIGNRYRNDVAEPQNVGNSGDPHGALTILRAKIRTIVEEPKAFPDFLVPR